MEDIFADPTYIDIHAILKTFQISLNMQHPSLDHLAAYILEPSCLK